jgi:hypothetical protein
MQLRQKFQRALIWGWIFAMKKKQVWPAANSSLIGADGEDTVRVVQYGCGLNWGARPPETRQLERLPSCN